ncbi:MAG: EamA family transporter [Motiliproteus sp.]
MFGLGAALLQSVSYLFSALFISRYQTGAVPHLILVHVVIGALSLLLLPFLWHPLAADFAAYGGALISTAVCYLCAQYSLYQAIRHSVASRVSPLLGLKVLVLAFLGSVFLGQEYLGIQWLAVGLCFLGALWLSASGGRISGAALAWVVAACCGYALSDLSILYLMQYFSSLPLLKASMLSVTLCFLLCGLGSVVMLPRLKQRHLLLASSPAAICWLLAMGCLFACFSELGVVFGGIVQSSRGLISILLALLLAYIGLDFADPVPARKILAQRLLASVLMMLAIIVFALGSELR